MTVLFITHDYTLTGQIFYPNYWQLDMKRNSDCVDFKAPSLHVYSAYRVHAKFNLIFFKSTKCW